MIYISLAILTSIFLLAVFKLFQRFGVNSFAAIIVNYITAAITGLVVLQEPFTLSNITNASWLKICLPLGVLFISIFYLISLTAQRISLATASIANKMSVVIPVLYSVFMLGESLNYVKFIGILVALLSVVLSSWSGDKHGDLKKLIWLPTLVFIGSGLIDLSINAANAFYIKSETDSALFSITTFISAFSVGIATLIILIIAGKLKARDVLNFKNLLGGVVLGIPNFFSIYFIFKSLDTKLLSSSQLFPVLNVSNVMLSGLVGWLIFKEKLSPVNFIGIALALLAIILIAL